MLPLHQERNGVLPVLMKVYLMSHHEGVGVGVAKVSLVEVLLVVHEDLEVLKVSLEVNLSKEPGKKK